MKNTTYGVIALAMTLALSSCKKDKKTETPESSPITSPVVYDNYSQLKTGNYWIYQQFVIDTSGNATPQNIYDSCYVEKDTMIHGRNFFKIYSPHITYNYVFMSDSLHYIIGPRNSIVFSSQDFTTVFGMYANILGPQDTLYKLTVKMEDKDQLVSVPAGNFTTSNFKQTYYYYPNYQFTGQARRIMSTRYAKNVGIVTETLPFFSSNPNYTERRLVRYHLN